MRRLVRPYRLTAVIAHRRPGSGRRHLTAAVALVIAATMVASFSHATAGPAGSGVPFLDLMERTGPKLGTCRTPCTQHLRGGRRWR